MDEPATSGHGRILIIGKSPGVILDAAGILRGKGLGRGHPDRVSRCPGGRAGAGPVRAAGNCVRACPTWRGYPTCVSRWP